MQYSYQKDQESMQGDLIIVCITNLTVRANDRNTYRKDLGIFEPRAVSGLV